VEEELAVVVDPLSEAGSEDGRYLYNLEWAYEKIREALDEDPDEIEMVEYSSSYEIWLNGTIVKQRKGVFDETALREIFDYIRNLSRTDSDRIAISWNWDDEVPGDAEGDIIVSIDEYDNGEWDIIDNWSDAKDAICRALGIRE
jgi:hypothetical protein